MISLGNKRFSDVPKSLTPSKVKNALNKIISNAPSHKVTSGYNTKTIRSKLRKYQGEKCVYCESKPLGSSSFRVDHYRPKKFVKEHAHNIHYGYYWLALE